MSKKYECGNCVHVDVCVGIDALTESNRNYIKYCPKFKGSDDFISVRRGKWVFTKEHLWYKDEDGEIDEFRYESGFHNGPMCKICGETICVNCNPNWKESECLYGHYKCSECGNPSEEGKEKYCSSCGAIMKDE